MFCIMPTSPNAQFYIMPTSPHAEFYIMPTLFLTGFFFGRTSLIKLSPKKTWEGFLGAFVSTVVFAFIVSHSFVQRISLTIYHPSLPPPPRTITLVLLCAGTIRLLCLCKFSAALLSVLYPHMNILGLEIKISVVVDHGG